MSTLAPSRVRNSARREVNSILVAASNLLDKSDDMPQAFLTMKALVRASPSDKPFAGGFRQLAQYAAGANAFLQVISLH
jgi:hypothetical protein